MSILVVDIICLFISILVGFYVEILFKEDKYFFIVGVMRELWESEGVLM